MSISEEVTQATDTNTPDPKGWEQYSEEVGAVGSAVTRLPRPTSTERDLLIQAGFDPEVWCIVGPVQARKWMTHGQEWLYYYKFNVAQGESEEQKFANIEDLTSFIRTRSPVSRVKETHQDAWAFFVSDPQIGKREGDFGTEQTVDRYIRAVDEGVDRVKELRRTSRAMPHGVIAGLGDIVEGCHGFYAGQPFLIDLNRRDQKRVAREILSYTIDAFSPLFDRLSIATVGGNHGEHRNDGSKATDGADNDDVATFEEVKFAYDKAGIEYDWRIPQGELSMAVDAGGINLGLTHGHIFRKGSTPQQKAVEWFKGQVFGGQAVKDSRILVSAHFHHYLATSVGTRTLFQTGPMDPGSKWVTDGSGEESVAAVLTMRLDGRHPMGYADVQNIAPVLR